MEFINIISRIMLLKILKWLVIAAVVGIILFFVIRATCKYQARKNAEAFDYDYLAERIAEETCKRLMIIEKQKEMKNDNGGDGSGNFEE